MGGERARRRQHAAGEDEALDEVGAEPVFVEVRVGDRDHLDDGDAARAQPLAQGAK
jgi:hypothetical protein